jgi:hypothetical protein
MSRKPRTKSVAKEQPVYQDPPLAEYVANAGYDTGGADEPKRAGPAPEIDITPAVMTAEAMQRAANRSNHSGRTYNGGKKLAEPAKPRERYEHPERNA